MRGSCCCSCPIHARSVSMLPLLCWIILCIAAGQARASEEASQDDPGTSAGTNSSSVKDPSVESLRADRNLEYVVVSIFVFCSLIVGFIHMCKVLATLESRCSGLESLLPDMRPVRCGGCNTKQQIPDEASLFVCFACNATNRIRQVYARLGGNQVLVTDVGPTRRYELVKEGENFWRQLHVEEVRESGVSRQREIAHEFHNRGNRCLACQVGPCSRLSEFSPLTKVAYLPRQRNGQSAIAGAGASTSVPATSNDLESGCNRGGVESMDVMQPHQPICDDELVQNQPVIIGRPMPDEQDDEEDAQGLSENNVQLCAVCYDRIGDIVMLPCSHGGVCRRCVTHIVQNKASGGVHCPHCRGRVADLVQLHLIVGGVAHGVQARIPMVKSDAD